MANQWFYTVGGKKVGPISFGQLQAIVQSGQLKPTDLVRQEGTGNWVAVLTVEGLVAKQAKVEAPQATEAGPQKESITNAVFHQMEAVKKGSQDPILAAIASLLLPPLGQLLLGQTTKAIALFISFPVLLSILSMINFVITEIPFVILIIPAYGVAMAVDAFLNAKKVAEGKSLGKWEFFAQWSPY